MSAFVLKIIAMITMFIDHFGARLMGNMPAMRVVGRIAFVLYAFMAVEGFRHTSNRSKYLLKLFVLAIVSEIPFNLMEYRTLIYMGNRMLYLLSL